jgi:hypothetical protein
LKPKSTQSTKHKNGPKIRCTSWHTRDHPANPDTDAYFPIGQSAMNLMLENGIVKVRLKTLTPNFQRFEIRTDGGDWKTSAEECEWNVRPGLNRLEGRTVNTLGVTGPVATAELAVKE